MSARISRRGFLAGSASLVALIAAMHSRRAEAASRAARSVEGPYGPLREALDLETGLPLILLPEGFQYRTYSWAGDAMTNGQPTPNLHDGMGVIASRERRRARRHAGAQPRARSRASDPGARTLRPISTRGTASRRRAARRRSGFAAGNGSVRFRRSAERSTTARAGRRPGAPGSAARKPSST